MRKIRKVVVHHSAVKQPNINKLITSIERRHKNVLEQKPDRNWSYVAYHYIIGVNGEIKQTRDEASIGYHASNRRVNQESLWIMLSGNFDVGKPSERQLKSLYKLIRRLDRRYNFTIHFHRDFVNKSCPWKLFEMEMLDPENFTDLQTKLEAGWKECKWKLFEYAQTKNDCTKYASAGVLSTTIDKKFYDQDFVNLKRYSKQRGEPAGRWTNYITQGEITLDWWNKYNPENRVEWLLLPIVSTETMQLLWMGYRGMISRRTSAEIFRDWIDWFFLGKPKRPTEGSHATTIYYDRNIRKIVEINNKYGIFKINKTIYHDDMKSLIERWVVKPNIIFYVKY